MSLKKNIFVNFGIDVNYNVRVTYGVALALASKIKLAVFYGMVIMLALSDRVV